MGRKRKSWWVEDTHDDGEFYCRRCGAVERVPDHQNLSDNAYMKYVDFIMAKHYTCKPVICSCKCGKVKHE